MCFKAKLYLLSSCADACAEEKSKVLSGFSS